MATWTGSLHSYNNLRYQENFARCPLRNDTTHHTSGFYRQKTRGLRIRPQNRRSTSVRCTYVRWTVRACGSDASSLNVEDVDGIHKCCHSGVTSASSGDLSPRRTLTIQAASYRPSSLTKAKAKWSEIWIYGYNTDRCGSLKLPTAKTTALNQPCSAISVPRGIQRYSTTSHFVATTCNHVT